MAKAKAKSQEGGDSKQGLVISLVFSIILVIGLGVGTYMGFSGQKDLKEKAAAATKERDSKEKSRDWEKFKYLLMKVSAGYATNEETATFQDKVKDYEKLGADEKDLGDVRNLIAELKKDAGWEPGKPAAGTYKQLLANEKKGRQDTENLLKKEQDTNTKVKKDLEDAQKQYQEALTQAETKVKDANGATVTAKSDKSAEFQTLLADYRKMKDDLETWKTKHKDETDKLTKELERWKNEHNKIKEGFRDQRAKGPAVDLVAFDRPKGEIVRLDRKGVYAWINLGSDARVTPQLTFSVFAAKQGRPTGFRKGAVEVIRVDGPRLSTVRITDQTDVNRDPILTGDFLFNPTWNSNQKDHVAIAGFIDLTGDGRDGTQEFIRSIAKQGVEVDAYLDMKENKVKGDMNMRTSFLILGDKPPTDEAIGMGAESRGARLRNDLNLEMSKMEQNAKDWGITIISARRYMALIGYRLPKTHATIDIGSTGAQAITREKQGKPKTEGDATKEDADKPKEDKKPEKEAAPDKEEKPKAGEDKPKGDGDKKPAPEKGEKPKADEEKPKADGDKKPEKPKADEEKKPAPEKPKDDKKKEK